MDSNPRIGLELESGVDWGIGLHHVISRQTDITLHRSGASSRYRTISAMSLLSPRSYARYDRHEISRDRIGRRSGGGSRRRWRWPVLTPTVLLAFLASGATRLAASILPRSLTAALRRTSHLLTHQTHLSPLLIPSSISFCNNLNMRQSSFCTSWVGGPSPSARQLLPPLPHSSLPFESFTQLPTLVQESFGGKTAQPSSP